METVAAGSLHLLSPSCSLGFSLPNLVSVGRVVVAPGAPTYVPTGSSLLLAIHPGTGGKSLQVTVIACDGWRQVGSRKVSMLTAPGRAEHRGWTGCWGKERLQHRGSQAGAAPRLE